MSSPPRFKPANGDLSERVSTLEEHAGRSEEWLRINQERADEVQADLARRVTHLETWKVEALVAIGSIKMKIGFVMFLVGSIGGLLGGVIGAVIASLVAK